MLAGSEENGHRSLTLAIEEPELLSAGAALRIEHLCFPLARQHGGNCDRVAAAIPGATSKKPVTLSRIKASSRRTFLF